MRQIALSAALAFLFIATQPAAVAGQVFIADVHSHTPDVDLREGAVTPTDQQRGIVQSLGAAASWNHFGTPRSLINYDGYLASGLGADPAAAALSFVSANRTLFRLSEAGIAQLELYRNAPLAGSDAYAVMFRQRFGDLPAGVDGVITVGVANGAIAYVSSSNTGDDALSGAVRLTFVDAWLAAAADVGRSPAAVDAEGARTDGEWTAFSAAGFAQTQRARLVAVPTPLNGVRPAYETLLVDAHGGGATAFTHLIDAETGAVLVRRNIVYQSHPVEPQIFTGSVPQTNGACDADKGPWIVQDGEQIKSIDVVVEAALTTNDMVLVLKRDGRAVLSGDTLFSPEAIHYEPAAGVPAGSYTVQVCDFHGGSAWNAPANYAGTVAFHAAGLQPPYPPKWQVFSAYPALDGSSADTRQLWCWESVVQGFPEPGCEADVANTASRGPWDVNMSTDTPTFTTTGNNASAAEAWTTAFTPGPLGQRPLAANREYSFAWGNVWTTTRCDPAASGLGAPGGNDIDAAVTNLFAMHNRMHDWSYNLGFTEINFNGQANNFGNAGRGGDPLLGDAQAGAADGGYPSFLGRDNANIIPLPDGIPPITNMYLWQPLRGAFYSPCVDGDFDMGIIGHEFSHLTESRMIGKGGFRSGFHAGAMGESHADLLAVEHLNEYGFVPIADENPFAVAAYATGAKQRGVRNYPMNRSPLNFSNIGYDLTCTFDDTQLNCGRLGQVHSDGEIWSAVNFDLRRAFIAKYDSTFPASDRDLQKACADGRRSANQCPGNRRWVQLVIDSFLLMPSNPTMLDARDAQLAADKLRFGGANQAELWLAFASRGFGKDAFALDNADVDPNPDFASPLHKNARVTFVAEALDEKKAAVTSARIYVGHYEARVSQVADTDPATTHASGGGANTADDTADFAPGTYEFVAHAPGYGHVRFTETFKTGQARTVRIGFNTNWASRHRGATASGHGDRLPELIDDTERTNWQRTGASPDVGGSQVTVALASAAPVEIRRVNVSAMLRAAIVGNAILEAPTQNRFTALRAFAIETSTDGVTFTRVFTSPNDAFPADAPRPVAPHLILRSFALPAPVLATHVRIVVLTNQCTGQTQFHGVQDNDPLNVTDCRTGRELEPPLSLLPRDRDVRVAELQVFSR